MDKILEHRINEHRGAHIMAIQKEDDRIRTRLASKGMLNSSAYHRELQTEHDKIISGFVDQYGSQRPGIALVYKNYFEEFPEELTEEVLKEILEYEDAQCKRSQSDYPFARTPGESDGMKGNWEQSRIMLFANIKSQIRVELSGALKRRVASGIKGKPKRDSAESAASDPNLTAPWKYLHPKIVEVSKSKFEDGYVADSVESALKEINVVVKRLYKDKTQNELDGVSLMRKAFHPDNPILFLDEDPRSESGRNIQDGYMQLFAGAIMGIRNPKAHANIVLDENRGIHFLFLASLLMQKVDESIAIHQKNP